MEGFFDHEDLPRWCWLWRYSKRRSDPLTRSSGGVLAQQSLTPRSILPPNPPSSSSSSVQLHPNDIFCYLGAFVLSSRCNRLSFVSFLLKRQEHLVCFCSNTLSEIILKYFLRFWKGGHQNRMRIFLQLFRADWASCWERYRSQWSWDCWIEGRLGQIYLDLAWWHIDIDTQYLSICRWHPMVVGLFYESAQLAAI